MSTSFEFKNVNSVKNIEKVEELNYLGFTLSTSTSTMISKAKSKIRKNVYVITKRISTSSKIVKKIIHQAYVRSQFLY
jgi:hypothetical protein